MKIEVKNDFYKGPITSCEYFDDENLIIACGPYISLVNVRSYEERSKYLALKYRVIHKIIIIKDSNLIILFGQKALNILRIDNTKQFQSVLENYIELNDWVFDVYWQEKNALSNNTQFLLIVCAHNQCIFFNLNQLRIEKLIFCAQKCMLYSAKIFHFKNGIDSRSENSTILTASGTIYNEVLIWSPFNGQIFITLRGHQGVIFNIEYAHDAKFLYSTSDDRSINVWRINFNENETVCGGELFSRFYGHEARVWKCISFKNTEEETNDEPRTQYLCSIGEDLNCCVWDVNAKRLVYRFDAMRKGTKNIWSMCINEKSMELITGWADGGLRKIDLKHYVSRKREMTDNSHNLVDHNEWGLVNENEKDFIRNMQVLEKRIVCCTNLGALYLIDTSFAENSKSRVESNQKLLFKSILLSTFNCMSKTKLAKNTWLLAIGTLKGFVYLLNITFNEDLTSNELISSSISSKDVIKIDCLNCLGIEEEIAEIESSNSASTITMNLLKSSGSSKVFNLTWFNLRGSGGHNRYFLMICFSLINGLMHLYEYKLDSGPLCLISRLYMPQCKQRWLTCFSILSIRTKVDVLNLNDEESEYESSNKDEEIEEIYLVGGDKCGNLHLYRIENKKRKKHFSETDEQDSDDESSEHLKLIKPTETVINVTKENASISAIYCKEIQNSATSSFLIICCCKDDRDGESDDDEEDQNSNHFDSDEKKDIVGVDKKVQSHDSKKPIIKLINKYQINSYIDLIEQFIFENQEFTHSDAVDFILDTCKKAPRENNVGQSFDLENSLKLALCFYGDKFLLWNFQLNRSLFEFKCGGSKRPWDFELLEENKQTRDFVFRFFYVKNKSIGEARKVLARSELERPFNQSVNHLCQIFHGNTIAVCKYLGSSQCLLTGAEDTQLILTNVYQELNVIHLFRLQGHDSVIRCVDYLRLNEYEILLVSAGGKANIKLWKVIYDQNLNHTKNAHINRVVQLREFKRFLNRRKGAVKALSTNTSLSSSSQTTTSRLTEKPWLYVDLKSNPDIRFMDVCLFRIDEKESDIIMCFACSDGVVRIFRFNIETNKFNLVNKYQHNKCLLCLRKLKVQVDGKVLLYLIGVGTDGCLLLWLFSPSDEMICQKVEGVNQSGINDLALWQENESSEMIVATVGDDARLSVLELSIASENKISTTYLIKQDMAHASSIIGVKFLNKKIIASVSKDQRLIIWKIDYDNKQLNPIKVVFINVADVSSIDLVKLDNSNLYRVSLVGVGLEIIDLEVDFI